MRRSVIQHCHELAEETLQESEQRFRKVFEEGPLGMAIVGLNYRFVEVNAMLCRMVGYDADELTALTFPDITHPDDLDKDVQLAQQLFRGEIPYYTMEKRYCKKQGEILWIKLTASIIRDDHGRPRYYLAMIEDIGERRRAEQERERLLEELERRAGELDALIDTMTVGVMIADGEGNVRRVNGAGRGILGLPSDGSVPMTLAPFRESDVRSPDGRPLARDEWPISRALRGETFSQQELVYVRPDGCLVNLIFAGSVLRDEQGTVALVVNVFRDITEMRELERQREEFISVVAHDLRGAITTIRGYADFLTRSTERQALPEWLQRALEAISWSSRRMERMIFDLLDVSRIEAHRLALVKKPVDLVALVRAIVERSAELTNGQPVRVDVLGAATPVVADPDRIEQVLTNLLSNAAKYSYPETEIVVAVEPRPHDVTVSVTNLGPGILPEDRDKIFTRFYRARQALEGKAPGLGVGLYIARGLVEAHGGRLWVDSEPGRYATFHFTLPL